MRLSGRARMALGIASLASVALAGAPASAIVNPDDVTSVRDAYAATIAGNANVPTGWTGHAAGCVTGSESDVSAVATIANVNYFRAMNRLAPVGLAPAHVNAKAQAAALIFEASNQLSHTPSSAWACWTPQGAEAAARSNIALGIGGANTVGAYIADAGQHNEDAGHRRWLLSPRARTFGTGSTGRANAIWVIESGTPAPRPATDIVAWPPKGYVPWPLVYPRWSVSSNLAPGADYSAARVSVSANGRALPVTQFPAHNGYGDNTLVFDVGLPADLQANRAETAFDVTVTNVAIDGAARTLSYRSTAVDVDVTRAPRDVVVTAAAGGLSASWDAPVTAPAPITGYRVSVVDATGTTVVATSDVTGTTATFTGLADGSYRVDVRALSAEGASLPGSRPAVVGQPTTSPMDEVAPLAAGAPAPTAGAPALRRVRVVRTTRGRAARLTLRATTSVTTTVQRWSPAARRWVHARGLGRRGLTAGERSVGLGRFARGRYRVVITTPSTTNRPAARMAATFAIR